jgi:hypothetical protein
MELFSGGRFRHELSYNIAFDKCIPLLVLPYGRFLGILPRNWLSLFPQKLGRTRAKGRLGTRQTANRGNNQTEKESIYETRCAIVRPPLMRSSDAECVLVRTRTLLQSSLKFLWLTPDQRPFIPSQKFQSPPRLRGVLDDLLPGGQSVCAYRIRLKPR